MCSFEPDLFFLMTLQARIAPDGQGSNRGGNITRLRCGDAASSKAHTHTTDMRSDFTITTRTWIRKGCLDV